MKQFDVYIVDLDPTKGAEMRKSRPAVIISPDVMNKNLKTVLIAPLTHSLRGYPTRVPVFLHDEAGEIVLDQIRAVDKGRLKKKAGTIDKQAVYDVKAVLKTMFS